jgi:hypothetical protein
MSTEIDFANLNLPIPDSLKVCSIEQKYEIYQYLNDLTDHEKKTYKIAINHLGSSFNIYKSNGFMIWKKKRNPT